MNEAEISSRLLTVQNIKNKTNCTRHFKIMSTLYELNIQIHKIYNMWFLSNTNALHLFSLIFQTWKSLICEYMTIVHKQVLIKFLIQNYLLYYSLQLHNLILLLFLLQQCLEWKKWNVQYRICQITTAKWFFFFRHLQRFHILILISC